MTYAFVLDNFDAFAQDLGNTRLFLCGAASASTGGQGYSVNR
jgi:hypothetical protein